MGPVDLSRPLSPARYDAEAEAAGLLSWHGQQQPSHSRGGFLQAILGWSPNGLNSLPLRWAEKTGHSLLAAIGCCPTRRAAAGSRSRQARTHRLLRLLGFLAWLFAVVSVAESLLWPPYQTPPEHYAGLRERILGSTQPGRGNPDGQKVFIASNIVQEGMIGGPWGRSLLELVDILGEDNVFVSVYENDSGPGTQDALRELAAQLPCNSSIVSGEHVPLDGLPKTALPSGDERVKRIAYLARIRNQVLEPLNSAYQPSGDHTAVGGFGFSHANVQFDRVLFLNDVYFSAIEAVQLLFSTNVDQAGHAQYRAACAVDFVSKVMFYDTFVVRDSEGYGTGLMFFPWFAPIGQARSRNQVLQGSDAVQVRSCWGGMVAFQAELFQRFSTVDSTSHIVSRFRHDSEPFWESSECCLIFADWEDRFGQPNVENQTGVFLNPYVRVAYSRNTWKWLGVFRRFERIFANLQYLVSRLAYPEHNPRRTHLPGQKVRERVWQSNADGQPGGSFQTIQRIASPGGFCGQRRMFVMAEDIEKANRNGAKNWEKIPVP
ncbi:hypothetical protein MGYG_01358 [Nannizzia gypsea CBS 118893]|uniref:Alpha-1,3-mannosyltransferase CMT1 n=1 Tax=Arthroderma gypseum (strain ATCC MYA-4604 / CBS 118893) TaxID=535722 RepID=E5R0C9_ARTGP|nr:hypothetical protein MGYG_01358 [Nannizzia gypsea CBS 118893]EFQ98325.1 hypothetical protein MGYG_01358 [Nannizzia gypsea CBS 118893]